MIRAIAVTAFQQNYRQHCADEEHHAKRTNEHKEPRFIDAQIRVARKFNVFNMVGIQSPESCFAHEGCEAWLGVIIAWEN